MKENLKKIWPHIKKERKKQLIILFSLMLIGVLAEIVSLGAIVPFVTVLSNPEKVLDMVYITSALNFFNISNEKIIVVITLAFGLLVLMSTMVRILLTWVTNKVIYGIGYDMGVEVFSVTIKRPYSWHISQNSSSSLAGIGKVQSAVLGYLYPILNLVISSIIGLGIIATLMVVDVFVAVVGTCAFGLFYLLVALVVRKRVSSNGAAIARANTARLKELQEALGGIRDIILDSSQQVYINRFSQIDFKMRTAEATNSFLSSSPRILVEGVGLLIIAGFALFSASAGGLEELLPILAVLGVGAQKLMPLIQTVYHSWNSINANEQNFLDVLGLIEAKVIINSNHKISFQHSITLKDVYFNYPSAQNVAALKNINLTIHKGQVIGVVGQTGSGKSTLVDILLGLISISSGKFLVDEQNIDTEEKLRSWSLRVAHVPQSIFLTDDSIMQNIAFGVKDSCIDINRVHQAAKAACIDDFILTLQDGYSTNVGERGVRLSGGQRQRIGIARALYRQSEFLVLDEATSALDSFTEASVIDNIHAYYPNLTTLMIAHRISTLRNCDAVITLNKGELVKTSSFEELQRF